VDTSEFPGKRHVIHIRFTDDARMFWIVVEAGEPSVCVVDPGYEVDVTMTATVRTMYLVWLGTLPLADAVRSGELTFDGPSALVRRMAAVLQLSPLAETVIARRPA
jgi:hypothetical protein